MERLRRLFDLFEQKTSLLHLLDVSQRAQGVQIYIGGESGLVAARRVQRRHRAVRARRPRDRHARRDRSDADGLRARDPDRRRHGQAPVQRADAAAERLSERMRDAHPNAALIERFYAALARRDAAAMVACYAPDATFSDPVFRPRRGAEVGAMWAMLCARGTRPRASTWRDVARRRRDAAARTGSRRYTFSATGRPVAQPHRLARSRSATAGSSATSTRFDLWRWSRRRSAPRARCSAGRRSCSSAIRAQAQRGFDAWTSASASAAPTR